MMKHPRSPAKATQHGAFILEALVSVLLLSIGLISLMMMATQAASQTGQAKFRNDASYLAGELIGEVWTSPAPSAFNTSAWQTRVSNLIPGGDGSGTTITPSGSGAMVSIVITWPDKKTNTTHQYLTTAQVQQQ
ncbi:MAG: hypothetical protein JSR19_13105 [Proteobacteria bacterium]|nr:hypothetical protein [Pseudomonadota bacterium]HQR03445.1 hypothetical protein [Rhodocyclaceae bacterium]